MKEIFIFSTLESWLKDKADTSIKGTIISRDNNIIEIYEENNYTQLINLAKVFAIVY